MRTVLCTLLLLVVCGSALGWWGGRRQPRIRPTQPPAPADPLVGQTCSPRFTQRCGSETVLSTIAGPANGFGPNVCRMEQTVRVQVFSYVNRQHCYNRFWRGRRCYTVCSSTRQCDATREQKKIKVHCCEGFSVRMLRDSLRRDGCPIKLEDTVGDCLDRLNMTMLLDDESLDSLEMILDDGDNTSTLFAPTTLALMDTDTDNNELTFQLVASHVATGSFRAEQLFSQQRLATAASGRFIHVTRVKTSGSSTKRLFVSGIEITRANACLAKNGIVHVIDGVIMSSARTIQQMLDSTPEVSSFKELVSMAGLNDFLSRSRSLTVFAPNNDAIDSNTMTCLGRPENRQFLRTFVKFHIVTGAEYASTIRLRTSLSPKSCHQYKWYFWRRCSVPVTTEGENTIVAGSRIVDADIAASNGVIHSVSRPLNNPNLDLSARCPPPTTQPTTATTSAPTAPPSEDPSTTASTGTSPTTASTASTGTASTASTASTGTSPTTVSESPSATRPPDETVSRPTTQPSRPPDEA